MNGGEAGGERDNRSVRMRGDVKEVVTKERRKHWKYIQKVPDPLHTTLPYPTPTDLVSTSNARLTEAASSVACCRRRSGLTATFGEEASYMGESDRGHFGACLSKPLL